MNFKAILKLLVLTTLYQFSNAQNNQRTIFTINELWQFKKSDKLDINTITADNQGWQYVQIPHTWNDMDSWDETKGYYRGIGWYKKEISLNFPKDKHVFIYFEAANQVAELYINGQFVGKHIGGYTSFCFDITKFVNLNKKNSFYIKLDNSHNSEIVPLSADFTFFGGIYRDVYLITTNDVYFDMSKLGSNGIFISTPKVSETTASVEIKAFLKNESLVQKEILISNTIKDADNNVVFQKSSSVKIEANSDQQFIDKTITINKPHLWSPEYPFLYKVETKIVDSQTGVILDYVNNPLGLRWFKFDADQGFFLNGKPYKLIGTNRHQDFKGIGNALSDDRHWSDIKMLKDMGSNFLRISHYPQDPAILEACDKLGLIVSEEIPIVDYITQSQVFTNNCQTMVKEMIYRDYNHPCVVIWCYGNETLLGEGAYRVKRQQYYDDIAKLFRQLDSTCRKEDPYRYTMLVYHLSEVYEEAKLVEIPMVTGWNLYLGWYGGTMSDLPNTLDSLHKKYPKQPFLITEYGAGSDPRIHNTLTPERFDHSMEYQIKFLDYYYTEIQKRPFICGSNMWTFADFNVDGRIDATPNLNNKGLVTHNREPKDVYFLYKSHLTKEPFICIPSKLWVLRTGRPDNNNVSYCSQVVEVYSNLSKAELFLNNVSLGEMVIQKNRAVWNVPFVNGENILEVKAANEKSFSDLLRVQFKMQPFYLKNKNIPFDEISINAGSHCYFVDTDEQNVIYEPDKPYEEGSWGFIGGKEYRRDPDDSNIIGSDQDILSTSKEPVFQTQRVGMEAYKFDVPDATYEVTLQFSELIIGKKRKTRNSSPTDITVERIFDVLINDQITLNNFNIADEYGMEKAISKKFIIQAVDSKGITISFKTKKNQPVINGIRIKKLL